MAHPLRGSETPRTWPDVLSRFPPLPGTCPRTRTEGFTLSTDPFFVDKVHDVVGLYLDPLERALVFCVDWGALSMCQAPRTGSFLRSR